MIFEGIITGFKRLTVRKLIKVLKIFLRDVVTLYSVRPFNKYNTESRAKEMRG